MPKTVEHCRKYPVPYLNTLNRTISYLNTLSRTIPYLNTLSRTIPYLNTFNRTVSQNFTVRSQSNLRITSPKSLAKQIRVLSHPKALGSGGGPFSALGSIWLARAYLNTYGPPTPPPQLYSFLYYSLLSKITECYQTSIRTRNCKNWSRKDFFYEQ